MASRRLGGLGLGLGLGLVFGLGLAIGPGRGARAGPPPTVDAKPALPLISSGESVVPCGWPSTVAVTSGILCSGALIHPRVVVYAAHCGSASKTVRFGETAWDGGRVVAVDHCRAYPGYAGASDQGHDWAYCVLDEPVEELPIAPALYGCERELLAVGEEVAIVGYGQTLAEPSGIKRWAVTTLAAVTPSNNTTLVGDPDAGLASFCTGDSGGPALLRLSDGSWRTFGIASTVAGLCGGYGAHSGLAEAVAWIEQDSGIDLTPCHTRDGSWAPGPACTNMFASAPNLGFGTWSDWCATTPRSGPSTSCGPAWDAFDDTALASVSITAPTPMQTFLQGTDVLVEVAAIKHPEGFAIASVSLRIDAEIVAIDEGDPWEFSGLTFPGPGIYTLVAIARDWAGNEVESEPVVIGWGETEFPDPGTETGDADLDLDPDMPAKDPRSGCSLGDAPTQPWPIALFTLVLLARARRRTLVIEK